MLPWQARARQFSGLRLGWQFFLHRAYSQLYAPAPFFVSYAIVGIRIVSWTAELPFVTCTLVGSQLHILEAWSSLCILLCLCICDVVSCGV